MLERARRYTARQSRNRTRTTGTAWKAVVRNSAALPEVAEQGWAQPGRRIRAEAHAPSLPNLSDVFGAATFCSLYLWYFSLDKVDEIVSNLGY